MYNNPIAIRNHLVYLPNGSSILSDTFEWYFDAFVMWSRLNLGQGLGNHSRNLTSNQLYNSDYHLFK